MKKLVVILLCIMEVFMLSACQSETGNGKEKGNEANPAEYQAIYSVSYTEPFAETEATGIQKASYGYTLMNRQGYNGWYYKSGDELMSYSEENGYWGDGNSYISGSTQHSDGGTAVSKVYQVKDGGNGTVTILGNVKNASEEEEAEFSVFLNGKKLYPQQDVLVLEKGDSTGYYFEVSAEVKAGDEISFQCSKGTLAVNPAITYDLQEIPVHFDFEGQFANGSYIHIGDVHPFWNEGKMYMYYLRTDGTYTSELIVSEDLINYTEQEIRRVYPYPTTDKYYVLGITPYEGKFVSYFGASRSEINASVSTDLLQWSRLNEVDSLVLPGIHYPSGGRDPYLFYDPDVDRYRIIYNGIYSNQAGVDFDTALSLQTSVSSNLEDGWLDTEKELLRFDNAGRSKREDPECPQMFKIGDRWYIFTSLYGRSAHGVGRLSYWKGDAGAGIDEVDWSKKGEQFLDGEDICAAQLCEINGKYYMFGWVPQTSESGLWGGALSLAREVYQLENGDLATRLDPALTQLLNKGKIFCADEENVEAAEGTVTVQEDTVSLKGQETKYDMKNFAQAVCEGTYGRSMIDFTLDLSAGSMGGIMLQLDGSNNISYLYIDRSSSMMYAVTRIGGENNERSHVGISVSDWSNVEVKILIDGNIADVFVNDTYSMAAKLTSSYTFDDFRLSMFASGKAGMKNFTVSKLSSADMLHD